MGCPEKLLPPEAYGSIDGRPGICMIHIEGGHSHAFYWARMDARSFQGEPFRMALTFRRVDGRSPVFSAIDGLERYAGMLRDFAAQQSNRSRLRELAQAIERLACQARGAAQAGAEPAFQRELDDQLRLIQRELLRKRRDAQAGRLRHATNMIARIFHGQAARP
jgi:hypothetical protein